MDFWYAKPIHVFSWLLMPLSSVVWLVSNIKRLRRNRTPYRVPLIVVGNVTVGGTGKTPTIIWLANLLQNNGYRVGVVSRGYRAKPDRAYPVELRSEDSPKTVGDEPKLISVKTNAQVIIDPNRHRAVERFCSMPSDQSPEVIISDDGLQHYKMYRDVEIVLIDATRGLGNQCLLPAGPLRETKQRLNSIEFLFAKEEGSQAIDYRAEVAISVSASAKNVSDSVLEPQSVRLISAIGNGNSFQKTALQAGYTIEQRIDLRDHDVIPNSVIGESSTPILVTEKDFIKLVDPPSHIYYLPFEIEYSERVQNSLLTKIQACIHEKSHHHSRSL